MDGVSLKDEQSLWLLSIGESFLLALLIDSRRKPGDHRALAVDGRGIPQG